MHLLRLLLLPLLALSFLGMAKKQLVSVRFHVEANARDGEPFSVPAKFSNPPRDGFVERIPIVSERDVKAIYPVPAQDGSFGCVFKLDPHGSINLQTISTQRRGASIVAVVSTKSGTHQVIDMIIDKPITDGIIFVPRGFTELEMQALSQQFPTLGGGTKRK